jgi:GntR family transcriptional regulator
VPPRYRYEEIADDLLRRIEAGEFPPGSRLPSRRDLIARYGVTEPVIRPAILSPPRGHSRRGGQTRQKLLKADDLARMNSAMVSPHDVRRGVEIVDDEAHLRDGQTARFRAEPEHVSTSKWTATRVQPMPASQSSSG